MVRRAVAAPTDLAFSRASGQDDAPVAALARSAATRGASETGCERAKGAVGRDQDEGRSWAGWHRHVTRCLLAHAFLELTRAAAGGPGGPSA